MKKLNWGNGIFIVILLFIAVMLFFVYKASQQKIDLVSKDYYPDELQYEKEIIKRENAEKLTGKLNIEQRNSSLSISFPEDFKSSEIKGMIHLYRPSDIALDLKDSVRLEGKLKVNIPASQLKKGKYILYIDISDDKGKGYLFQETIVLY